MYRNILLRVIAWKLSWVPTSMWHIQCNVSWHHAKIIIVAYIYIYITSSCTGFTSMKMLQICNANILTILFSFWSISTTGIPSISKRTFGHFICDVDDGYSSKKYNTQIDLYSPYEYQHLQKHLNAAPKTYLYPSNGTCSTPSSSANILCSSSSWRFNKWKQLILKPCK